MSEGSAALRNFAESAFSFQHWDGETWAATTIDSGSWGTISCPGCDNRLTVSFDDGTQDRTEVFVGGSHLGVYWDESAGRWDLQAYDTVVQKLLYEQLNLSQ